MLNYSTKGLKPYNSYYLKILKPLEANIPNPRSDMGKGLTVFNLPRTVLLDADRLDGDEARCVLGRPVHV